ncbi:hypothetical protein ACFY71_24280 [Streptomyces cinerochromogenes]|uniref:hypothetical protein n=1 Tax=Streptomyces cinerochromogenes TaxID=66422 RepID=UPI00369EF323
MLRLRLKVLGCPRRALALTDTPRPDCPECAGSGAIESFYGDYDTGEYAGSDFDFCDCWTAWSKTLLPLPRWPRRTPPGGYSDEPPF